MLQDTSWWMMETVNNFLLLHLHIIDIALTLLLHYQIYEFHSKKCNALQENDFVFIEGRPCRIHKIMTATQNEHAMVIIIRGTDLFSRDFKENQYLPTDLMDIPIVKQTKYQFVSGILQRLFIRSGDWYYQKDIYGWLYSLSCERRGEWCSRSERKSW